MGTATLDSFLNYNKRKSIKVNFKVSSLPDFNLLGRPAIHLLNISVDKLIKNNVQEIQKVDKVYDNLKPDKDLQRKCKQLCDEYSEIFSPGLGKLKDFELEVQFIKYAERKFCKTRTVPFAIQDDL